jgi:hypothetical protein
MQAREAKEAVNRKRLASGELGLDIYGMRDKLAAAGCAMSTPMPRRPDTASEHTTETR